MVKATTRGRQSTRSSSRKDQSLKSRAAFIFEQYILYTNILRERKVVMKSTRKWQTRISSREFSAPACGLYSNSRVPCKLGNNVYVLSSSSMPVDVHALSSMTKDVCCLVVYL